MKSHAKVVVIGGGVVGCSVLFHLARHGWTDVVLLERDELTSGSTWHAAGGMHTINGDPNVAKLQKYTISLYKEIEELSGQATGVHLTGGVLLAATEARLDWLRGVVSKGRYLGIDLEVISAKEAAELMPLIDPKQFVGAVRNKEDGHLDPSGVTHAYAKAARKLGAEVERFTKVEDIVRRPDGLWRVITNKGEVVAEHVVNAGGLWAREVGRMVGLELPVLAMEHMYLITEDMPEVADWNRKTGTEIIHAVDFDGELYLRQERGGMLMGTYEKANKVWSEFSTPWNFGHELLEPDIDRIAPSLEVGFRHFPAFEKTGIKQIINGPFTFAPDGNPLVGPVRGLPGFWVACGVMAGFSQGGGVGLALSNWMIEGDPGADIWAMDVARYGDWATMAYTNAKVRENYSRRFSIRFPNEELPAGRPLKTTPVYDTLSAKGAQWGVAYGLEVPLWYAPEGVKDEFSWRRSSDFDHVAKEVAAVRNGVGLAEISSFAKYKVTGEGAAAWLDRMLACKLPKPGRMALAPMLKEDGKLIGDFTLANIGDGEWFIAGSGVAEQYHMRWFEAHLPKDGSVRIEALEQKLTGLAIAGPKAREVLAKVTRADVSNAAFPFMASAKMDIGMAPCLVGRVSYTGDLGYEIWVAPEYQRAAYQALTKAGEELGIGLFGSRALNALRLEKNYGSWAREYRPIYGPVEAGLDRFVAYGKEAGFIGKEAALAEREQGGRLRLRAFIVEADDADVIGDEAIWHDGAVRGWVTSGGYAHHSKKSVAMGYVPKEIADKPDGFEIEILGKRHAARIQAAPLFDANFERMRA
ncbi:FAD-dependent oxidoreductase [Mesorhizobium sp. M1C.F.Ca.ET.193.01.1.1]|uniref:GcvT family protein n=1 Tax=unclassified Mesorhizobium TaxID=325217 RepID=UPI000FD2456F|nr:MULTISPECIES: FAD-dependent oxidoreductase [unclassified Mesorhizobium]TGT02810.1 FAD-dependent oxidoreductase [bacterium M00.F.Ca.ET.177.01.1.1]TGQ55671.1 FAD-dependent oxidoreductase [Mesorhizobium sp. M1C.F.Ca.ET.210.01.1.1]TGQ74125.1 FAD-dependent oxidoreductase [Mesorhizobium sp. M1C.F.Ca.ET.212.01.1.1]TGR12755.1 FAD-dependent oxidoreductase [Mesorhizobium sp. M1C.F.Ca.ET.204.01.1.1]TGR32714.1 FAD-dependent oxidoreductase [Mesorhizobium sp. M1C.F.Ca.ET.196.01.1.1]